MILVARKVIVPLLSLALMVALAQTAAAQRGGGFGRMGGYSRVQLATLDNVQANLKLTADQKSKISEINTKLSEDRRAAFQGGGGGGDLTAAREKMEKMNNDATAKVMEVLDDAQKKRITQVFVQANGGNALTDMEVAKSLNIADDQKKQLEEVRAASAQESRDAIQDLQGASQEERRAKLTELQKAAQEKMLAVLTADQKAQFESLKGEPIELDLSQLRFGGRRGAGN